MASCRPIPRDAPTIRATGFVETILSDRVEHLYKILSTSIAWYGFTTAQGFQVTTDSTPSRHCLNLVKELHSYANVSRLDVDDYLFNTDKVASVVCEYF